MELKIAERKRAKIKIGLQGCSGSGKTYGALLIAYGLCGHWEKIAVIDSENQSAMLYAHLGSYFVLNISQPFTPEKYMEAIRVCEKAGIEVIIIDSISHEWEGPGGILDIHGNMSGNSFTNWAKVTPRHNAFIQTILQSNAHIIATIRSKQDYVLNEKNGKLVPEKVGLKGVTRDGLDYEMTIVFDLDIKHNATASKDRTGLFMDKPAFKISEDTGKAILNWCQHSMLHSMQDDIVDKIDSCSSLEALTTLYIQHPQWQQSHINHFTRRKLELQTSQGARQNNFQKL